MTGHPGMRCWCPVGRLEGTRKRALWFGSDSDWEAKMALERGEGNGEEGPAWLVGSMLHVLPLATQIAPAWMEFHAKVRVGVRARVRPGWGSA